MLPVCYDLQTEFAIFLFIQAAVAEGEAPAGLPVKKSGTAPSLTQTEVSTIHQSQTFSWNLSYFSWGVIFSENTNSLIFFAEEMFLLG
jgi:hypothetical protein